MVNDTLGLLLDKLVVTSGGEGGGFDFGSVFPVTSVCYFLNGERRRRKIRILLLFSFSNSRSRLEANFESFAENSMMSIGIFISNLS